MTGVFYHPAFSSVAWHFPFNLPSCLLGFVKSCKGGTVLPRRVLNIRSPQYGAS